MIRRWFVVVVAIGAALGLVVPSVGASNLSRQDKAIARAGLFRSGDLPAGWDRQRADDSEPTGLKSCRAIDTLTAKSRRYMERSPLFVQGQAQMANVVFMFPDVKKAKAYLAAYQQRGLECTEDIFTSAAPDAEVTVQAPDPTAIVESGVDDAFELVVVVEQPTDVGTEVTAVLHAILRIGSTVYEVLSASPGNLPPELGPAINASLGRLLLAKTKA